MMEPFANKPRFSADSVALIGDYIHGCTFNLGSRLYYKNNARIGMILTKTLRLAQSKENSTVLWEMHHAARWAFNEGVRLAFDNPGTTPRKMEGVLTKMRKKHGWLGKYQRTFLRANFIDGCKSARLSKNVRNEKGLHPLRSPRTLFRKKQDWRQPALRSFQKPDAKGSTFDIGSCKIHLKDSFEGQVRSFQIVETTKKTTKRTRPEDRTYEIHVQYRHEPEKFHEGDTKAIDLNANNMWGMATPDNGSLQVTKLPHGAKHRKYDKDTKMQSKQSRVKKNGRTYKDLQRKRRAKNEKITNRRKDFIRKTLVEQLRDAAVVMIEGLKISSMTKKGPGKRGLNRVMYHSAMGYVKDAILQYCEKHGIPVVIVPPHGTGITCSVCGNEDKESRNDRKFACTNCGHENHADLNSPENLFHRAESGAAGNVVCKQKDAMGRIHLKVKKFQKERTNPERLQFGTMVHSGYYGGVLETHLPRVVPLLLEKHKGCTNNRCVYPCM